MFFFFFFFVPNILIGQEAVKLCQKEGLSEEEQHSFLVQLADGFLFAGMFGTTHLSKHTVDRIWSDPRLYLPMWNSDQRSFVLESARLDPPVASVTVLLPEDRNVTFPKVI